MGRVIDGLCQLGFCAGKHIIYSYRVVPASNPKFHLAERKMVLLRE